jgi:glyoxylase-like metal-dependent hydrolase (beta-lactamase superfamily II)
MDVCKLDISPVKFLVLTHWHWDHVFGIETMNLITICHHKTKENLNKMRQLSWDDFSLDERVKKGEEIEFCSEMIKLEMPSRNNFKPDNADISFKGSLEIDLGGINCIIENIGGCHSKDSSLIYIPEEKTMFLGDSIYEDMYSGEWSYERTKLISMVEKIKKYETVNYLTSHNEPESKEEIWSFLNDLIKIGNFVGNDCSKDKVIDRYIKLYSKVPNEDEIYYINSFVNGNKKDSISN